MGYKIGVPSLKLNNVGKTSKHCGSFGAVTREALEEREGHDIDIDHTKSKDNVITGYRTSAELMEYSRQHCENLRDKSGRKLRADAVVMCGTIFKPPAVFINALSEEARKKFFDDCKEYFAGVVGKENIKSTVLHKDERAEHLHIFWEPMTADGRLCAKEVHNLKFFSEINHNLPAFLRERGWDIEDAQCYDCAAENYEKELQKSQQQLEAEYQKRNNSGLSSMEYKKQAEEKKRELVAEHNEIKKEISSSKAELDLFKIEAYEEKHKIQEEIDKARAEADIVLQTCSEQIATAQNSVKTTIQNAEEYHKEIKALKEEHSPMIKLYRAIQNFIKVVKDEKTSRAEIVQAAMNLFSPFMVFTDAIKNIAGYEYKHVSKDKHKTPELVSNVNNLLSEASEKANQSTSSTGKQKTYSSEDYEK